MPLSECVGRGLREASIHGQRGLRVLVPESGLHDVHGDVGLEEVCACRISWIRGFSRWTRDTNRLVLLSWILGELLDTVSLAIPSGI